MLPHMTWVLACFLLALSLGSCVAEEQDRDALQTRASGPPSRPDAEEDGEYFVQAHRPGTLFACVVGVDDGACVFDFV